MRSIVNGQMCLLQDPPYLLPFRVIPTASYLYGGKILICGNSFTASSVDRLGNDIQVSVPIWKYLLIGSFMASLLLYLFSSSIFQVLTKENNILFIF